MGSSLLVDSWPVAGVGGTTCTCRCRWVQQVRSTWCRGYTTDNSSIRVDTIINCNSIIVTIISTNIIIVSTDITIKINNITVINIICNIIRVNIKISNNTTNSNNFQGRYGPLHGVTVTYRVGVPPTGCR